MHQIATHAPGLMNLPIRARDFLDGYGRRGWIAAMIVGFVAFWPLGLALVVYMSLTNRWKDTEMFGLSRKAGGCCGARTFGKSSGNSAFDAYREDTLRRLEEEQQAFEGFLQRLRDAKDRQEFDAFMQDRAAKPARSTEPAAEA